MDEKRTTELEIKVAYLERTVDELSAVVRTMDEQIRLLAGELARRRATELEPPPPPEKPPHY